MCGPIIDPFEFFSHDTDVMDYSYFHDITTAMTSQLFYFKQYSTSSMLKSKLEMFAPNHPHTFLKLMINISLLPFPLDYYLRT